MVLNKFDFNQLFYNYRPYICGKEPAEYIASPYMIEIVINCSISHRLLDFYRAI